MADRSIIVVAVIFCFLFVGALIARQECSSGSVEWHLCAWLTEPGVRRRVRQRLRSGHLNTTEDGDVFVGLSTDFSE